MIDDPSFVFLFRLAFTLKKTVAEILEIPRWELESWRFLFDLYGPLDWKRQDFLAARSYQFASVSDDPLKEFLLFRDPSYKEPTPEESRARREEKLLKAFGVQPKKEEE